MSSCNWCEEEFEIGVAHTVDRCREVLRAKLGAQRKLCKFAEDASEEFHTCAERAERQRDIAVKALGRARDRIHGNTVQWGSDIEEIDQAFVAMDAETKKGMTR